MYSNRHILGKLWGDSLQRLGKLEGVVEFGWSLECSGVVGRSGACALGARLVVVGSGGLSGLIRAGMWWDNGSSRGW